MAMKMTHISKTLLSIVCTLWGMSACSDDYTGDTVERYQPFVWWFFRVAGRFGLYQFAVERAGVRGSWIGLDSSPIKDRISFLL